MNTESLNFVLDLRMMKNVGRWFLTLTFLHLSMSAEKDMEGFVVGGTFVHIEKYPHSAYIDARCESGGHWICGSAILNQKILITAGHCLQGCELQNELKNKVVTLAGHANLKMVSIKRKVIDMMVHPDFNEKNMENDLALAVVKRNFPLGNNVKRVIISKKFPHTFKNGYIAGWGLIKDDSSVTSIILKQVHQKLRSKTTCSLIGHLHDGMFCAGCTSKTASHPAQGDSGSALVIESGTHQIGLVSFCIHKYPALMVYTNVSYYYQWISTTAKLLHCRNDEPDTPD